MGIVLKQSFRNTFITYLGFGIGAINILFLYTNFLTDEYFGLVGVLLSTATILMPLMAFGVPNTLVKYFSSFIDTKDKDGFLTLMLLLPLAIIIPCTLLTYIGFEMIGDFLSKKNTIVKGYVWYIFLIGLAMAYFEVFYAWSKVQMKSVFGNFMKEVFARICVTVLLCLVYFKIISVDVFLMALVCVYLLRTIIMKLYAYTLKFPKLNFTFPKNTSEIIKYSAFIILGASASVIVLEIDRFMINQYIAIENVAYYSVAIFIATVIVVPSRAMHQITYPLTAELMNKKDGIGLKELYQKSSLTLFIVSGLLFVLIILNLSDLYTLVPQAYRGGFFVVFLIGLAKVYDALLGNNNSILYNSDHYKTVLFLGVFLAISTIVLNLWLIPQYGLNGAAMATFFAIVIFNTTKLFYVQKKFKAQPFTWETMQVLGLLLLIGIPIYFLQLPFHALINIALKSIVVVLLFVGALYRFRISKDIIGALEKIFKF
ncbi:O-antigen/teichoic acid export membrane protein [Saonia flava]|uniref:O-antigen/teichoic acid export membrane protein n=1 Tax=Saonia flava TaxID=523696 RepID=A0A846QRT6_9FLAO|nr:polysaccharide biosynthesis C-terminal domain-containing protein [Saonia flava]NJB69690.1 O-antigen/teichoic acid export membrane protein [Saonia flava]